MPRIPRSQVFQHVEDGAIQRLERSLAMRDAVEAVVANRMTLRQAELAFDVKKSSLHRQVTIYKQLSDEDKQNYNFEQKFGFKNIFSDEEENQLQKYLIDAANMCYGLSDQQARSLAYDFAVANNKTFPESWNTNRCAGKEWILGFRGRHPKLALRTPEATSLGRATSFNKHNVSVFYKNLKEVLEKYSF